MKVNRIKTYVKGLDEVMQGGIPEGSVILIAGKPGTMKSSFAFNILYHNANKEDMSGVYVTLEQGREANFTLVFLRRELGVVDQQICMVYQVKS
ncbi:MAG: RAD55 family ATPase [Thermoplasmata archaeon]